MEKAKQRFDNTAEELERILVTKEGESIKDASKLGFSFSQPFKCPGTYRSFAL